MSYIAEFAIFPTDKGESKSQYVSKVLEVISQSGLNFHFTSMGTIVEADTLKEITDLLSNSYEVLQSDCNRIYSIVKIDYRKDRKDGIAKKTKSVLEKIESN